MGRQRIQLDGEFVIFRDDDREGYELRLLRAGDGDFHLSIWPHHEDMPLEERLETPGLYSNSIRVRMPMIGGGSHPELYDSLQKLWTKARAIGEQRR